MKQLAQNPFYMRA